MLTSNYYAILTNLASCGTRMLTSSKIRKIGGSVTQFYNMTTTGVIGTEYLYRANHACLLPPEMSQTMTHDRVVFGTSLEPETIHDYKVTPLLSSMTFSVGGISVSYNEENKKYTITRRYIINNTTGSQQTITEYGIFGMYQSDSYSGTECLIYRELLSEPFTIDVNETVNFDLTLTYDLPAEYIPIE